MGILSKMFPGGPKGARSDEDRITTGDYSQAYPAGQRSSNPSGEPTNRSSIPDRQSFTIYYSTYIRSMTWERYRGRSVVGRGEGTITVETVAGAVIRYEGVSYKLFLEFATAPSKGQFFIAFFHHRPYTLLRRGTPQPRRTPLISEKQYPPGGRPPRNRVNH